MSHTLGPLTALGLAWTPFFLPASMPYTIGGALLEEGIRICRNLRPRLRARTATPALERVQKSDSKCPWVAYCSHFPATPTTFASNPR